MTINSSKHEVAQTIKAEMAASPSSSSQDAAFSVHGDEQPCRVVRRHQGGSERLMGCQGPVRPGLGRRRVRPHTTATSAVFPTMWPRPQAAAPINSEHAAATRSSTPAASRTAANARGKAARVLVCLGRLLPSKVSHSQKPLPSPSYIYTLS